MMRVATVAGVAALSVAWALSSPRPAQAQSAQSQSCEKRATQQGLTGKDRDTFHSACMKGSLTPDKPTSPAPRTAAAKALTEPSGSDRTIRSKACNAEAAKRGLKDSALQAFRKGCLASAAPVSAIETSKQDETPTKDKPKLDALIDAPRH